MASEAISARGSSPPKAALVVALLGLLVFINYVDRGNLATAGPLVKDELALTNTQFGILISAFFWAYAPAQLIAGWMAQRFNTYAVLTGGLVIWALATIGIGFSSGFLALLLLRLALGIGESVAFPCSSKLIAEQVPQEKLGMANAQIALGLTLGPAFGIFCGGLLMAAYGWRLSFILFGVLSLLWLIPWLRVQRDAGRHSAPLPDRSPSLMEIMRCRSAWGTAIGHFCINYSFYFLLAWLPLYLVKTQGFTIAEMAEIGGIVYLLQAAGSVIAGRVSDGWIVAGMSPTRARKTMLVGGCLIIGACMIAVVLGDWRVAIAALMVSGLAAGMTSSNTFAVGQTCAGPHAAGKWVGFQNFVGNIAGIVAPALTGYLVDTSGTFVSAFVIVAAVSVFGALCWGIVVRRVEPMVWAVRPA